MLTKEQNELLCQVGPGTPMGEVFRRYWIPVVESKELAPSFPKRFTGAPPTPAAAPSPIPREKSRPRNKRSTSGRSGPGRAEGSAA